MASNGWTRISLGEFVTLQRGHDLPEERRRLGNVPILGSFGITGWHDVAKSCGPGVTVGRSGASFGVVNYSTVDFWPLNTALYVTNFHGNDERFAYYLLKHFNFQGYNSGSAQPSLNRNFVHPVPIDVPPLPEQRAIAHILGTLDDKIELNRKMNQTLEAMARAIFKSWFVDFDPVRAKTEGRDPGLPRDLAALFPDSFEDSELGAIPKGWRVGRLDELLVLQRGFDLPTSKRTHGKYPVYAAGGYHGMHSEYMVKGPCVVTGRSGVLGNVFFVHEDFWPLNTTLWVKEFKGAGPIYAYHIIKNLDFEIFNAGSAVPTLNRNHVHNLPVVIPDKRVVEMYEKLSRSMFDARNTNRIKSRTLAALRDALLPKLLSGAIRVMDA